MADQAALQAKLLAALEAEPKPLTRERMLAVAKATLPSAPYQQFDQWSEKNGEMLLERLNG